MPSKIRTVFALTAAILIVAVCGVQPVRAQDALNVELLARLHTYDSYSDVWGYVAPDGTELAILGSVRGVSFVDATDPTRPVEVAHFPGLAASVRDMKTLGHYAYVMAGAPDGLRIFDLSEPRAPRLVKSDKRFFSAAHNIYMDTDAAHLYVCQPAGHSGILVLDLSDPETPERIAEKRDIVAHDIYVRDGLAYVAEMGRGSLRILDVSNLPDMPLVGEEFTAGLFTHNTFLDPAGGLCLTTDESIGGFIEVFDVSDPSTPRSLATWRNPSDSLSTVHNVTVHGSLAFASWYTGGLRVADIRDPRFPQLVGFYDTSPDDGIGFRGAFGIYPFQPSGTIYVSDMQTGLYLLRLVPDYGSVHGRVVDAVTGAPVVGARMTGDTPANTLYTSADGEYRLALAAGARTFRLEAFGYEPLVVDISLESGDDTVRDLTLQPAAGGSVRGAVLDARSGAPVAGARVVLRGTPSSTTTDALGEYVFTPVPTGSYGLAFDTLGWEPDSARVDVQPGSNVERHFPARRAFFADDAESDRGWQVGLPSDTATGGAWERAAPEPTGQRLFPIQPRADHSPAPGRVAFVTGALCGRDGDHDVDNGVTTLLSPIFDLDGVSRPVLRYARWFIASALGGEAQGSLTVDVTNDDGATWVNLETLTEIHNTWSVVEFDLSQYIEPSDRVRVRYVASDVADGRSIVEALIDDVQIDVTGLPDSMQATTTTPALVFRVRPNPFGNQTRVWMNVAAARSVRVDVIDVRGRRVRTLLDGVIPAGLHGIPWNADTQSGRSASAGVYFIRVDDGSSTQVQRVVLMR